MLELVKMALRISTDAFDDELDMLIAAALDDLGVAGVVYVYADTDPLIKKAVCTYCKLHFGMPDDADRLQKSYDEQKAQLSTNTGHTTWYAEV